MLSYDQKKKIKIVSAVIGLIIAGGAIAYKYSPKFRAWYDQLCAKFRAMFKKK